MSLFKAFIAPGLLIGCSNYKGNVGYDASLQLKKLEAIENDWKTYRLSHPNISYTESISSWDRNEKTLVKLTNGIPPAFRAHDPFRKKGLHS